MEIEDEKYSNLELYLTSASHVAVRLSVGRCVPTLRPGDDAVGHDMTCCFWSLSRRACLLIPIRVCVSWGGGAAKARGIFAAMPLTLLSWFICKLGRVTKKDKLHTKNSYQMLILECSHMAGVQSYYYSTETSWYWCTKLEASSKKVLPFVIVNWRRSCWRATEKLSMRRIGGNKKGAELASLICAAHRPNVTLM